MSDPVSAALVGATGLIGRQTVRDAARFPSIELSTIVRTRPEWLSRSPVRTFVMPSSCWHEALLDIRPAVLICALGTTWRKAGRDTEAFRAVDHDLVLATARAAQKASPTRMVVVSAAGASPASRSFYLRVKGEMEHGLRAMNFSRLDVVRPGLLTGERPGDRRALERAAIAFSPLADMMLRGRLRRYRSIGGATVAKALLMLARRTDVGSYVHHHDDIRRIAGAAHE